MTRNEVMEMMAETGVTFDEAHSDHINAEKFLNLMPPFMEWVLEDASVAADSVRYLDIKRLRINLYSDTEETEAEGDIEQILDREELRWRKTKEFIEELLMWNITYTLEV